MKIEYEGLPHYLEPEAALAHDAEPIHQAAEKPPKDDGTPRADGKEPRKPRPNVSKHVRLEFGDVDGEFARAQHVVSGDFTFHGTTHAAITSLDTSGVKAAFVKALHAARDRAEELGRQ